MPAEKANSRPTDESPQAASAEPGHSGGLAKVAGLVTKKWLLVLLGVSIVGQAAGFAYYRSRERPPAPHPVAEIPLGTFHFEADKTEGGRVAQAEFSLHVALLDPADRAAQQLIADRKYRVQQEMEQLLRKAHGGDFDDPALRDLKRQMQEQINQTLGLRAVSDVIITDLKMRRDAKAGAVATETAGL
jgi:flagellar basal body-associated protein FliL